MRQPYYRYNPKTCRYEPVKTRVADILIPVCIFLGVSTSLFVGLLFAQGILFTSDREKDLRHENRTLAYHHHELSKELNSAKASLVTLEAVDKNIQQKLVSNNTPANALQAIQAPARNQKKIRPRVQLRKTKLKIEELLHRANANNHYFAATFNLSQSDVSMLSNFPSLQPVENKELTKLSTGFGTRTNPFHKSNYFHSGIDFVAPRGTPVYATASGRITEVRKSELQMGDGNVIEIDHGNGYQSRYAHLGEIQVKPGQQVRKGTIIAFVGMTGGSVSPHVHFEILKNKKYVNPIGFLLEDVNSTDYATLLVLARQKNQSLD